MRYVAAYVLAQLGGIESPSVEDIKNIILAADGQFDPKQAEMVCTQLKGQDVEALIQKGKLKLGSLAPAASSSAAPVAQAAKTSEAPAKKVESEESEESSDSEGGLGSLFD